MPTRKGCWFFSMLNQCGPVRNLKKRARKEYVGLDYVRDWDGSWHAGVWIRK